MGSCGDPEKTVEVLRSLSSDTISPSRRVRTKSLRTATSLPSSPTKRKVFKSADEVVECFSPFDVLPVDADQTLWWKVPGVQLEDFYDWQLKINQVDDFTSTFCGIIKTSPYFERIAETDRQQIISLLNAPPEVFNSIAEHFEAKMNQRPKQDKLIITLNATEIGLFRYGKTMYAIQNVCPHQKGPLAMGDIEEFDGRLCITCPWHHWRFDLASGKLRQPYRVDRPPATVFPVKISDGVISVGFAEYNPTIFQDVDF